MITLGGVLTSVGWMADVAFYYQLQGIGQTLYVWHARLASIDVGSRLDKAAIWTNKIGGFLFGRNPFTRFGFYRAVIFLLIGTSVLTLSGPRTIDYEHRVIFLAFLIIVNFLPGIASFYLTAVMVRQAQWARRFWVVLAHFVLSVCVLLSLVYFIGFLVGAGSTKLAVICSNGAVAPYRLAVLTSSVSLLVGLYLNAGFEVSVWVVGMHLLLLVFLTVLHGIRLTLAFVERLFARTAERDFKTPLFSIAGAISAVAIAFNALLGAMPSLVGPREQVFFAYDEGLKGGSAFIVKYFFHPTPENIFYARKLVDAVTGVASRLGNLEDWSKMPEILNDEGAPVDSGAEPKKK